MERGNWTDKRCWYVSVQDAGRTALVLGPFRSESSCREWAYTEAEDGGSINAIYLRRIADKLDPRSHFYAWGMVKWENGHREGVLNKQAADDLRINGGMDLDAIFSKEPPITGAIQIPECAPAEKIASAILRKAKR